MVESPEAPKSAIRVWYFLRIKNIGDIVSPSIVSYVSKRETVLCADRKAPHLYSIGSILGSANNKTIVWGTGLMDPDQQLSQIVGSNVYAARGRLTLSKLRAAGVQVRDVPLGDPGYLVPDLFPGRDAGSYRLGVIPHYVDRQHPLFQRLIKEEGVVDLDVRADPAAFFRTLRSCDAVVSSSLHGLIFAEALGIPNLWVKLSDRVVRTGFKYRDWFSLAVRPQNEPYEPTGNETGSDLSARAATHGMDIDRDALARAFPFDRLDELDAGETRRPFRPVAACREAPLPVFIVSRGRGRFLRQVVESYRRLGRAVSIIIHHAGSNDPVTCEALEELCREGCVICKTAPVGQADEARSINETVQRFFQDWGEPSRYVVTDCDVDLSIADPAALDVYDELLNRYTDVQCVGPMLRVRDVSDSYSLSDGSMAGDPRQLWQRKPDWIDTSRGRVATLECRNGTAFALHRAGESFEASKVSRRVYYPYEARCLSWYAEAPPASTPRAANERDRMPPATASGERDRFIYVDEDDEGRLVEREYFAPASKI